MRQVAIIGAGMGGLATALRLRRHGFNVLVFEKQARPGGRSNLLAEHGFRADTGPTILVMKDTFVEFYRSLGHDLEARIPFRQIDPNYRIYFHDGTHLDLHSNMARLAAEVERVSPGASERLFRFIGDSARKYELAMDFVDRNYARITDLVNPTALTRLIGTRAYENLYAHVARAFAHNDKLTKAFSFHSMFLGLSPLEALAMYSLITYADVALGMWYPQGGIYGLIEDMLALADEAGIEIVTGAPVREIRIENGRAVGLQLESGEDVPADLVVSNADLPYTYRHLISAQHRRDYPDRRFDRMRYACSGYVLYLGVNKTYPHLQHQALYFAADYRANLDAIFRTRSLPDDPSFHLNNPTATDPTVAPAGHTLLYVLAPMPNLQGDVNWEMAAPRVREQLLSRLERIVDPDLRHHIVWERDYRPTDYQRDLNAVYGTAFGSLSHNFFQSSYFRPHNRAYDIQGLYFVGQGTYPGIGMPMVMISSRLVTERIVRECC